MTAASRARVRREIDAAVRRNVCRGQAPRLRGASPDHTEAPGAWMPRAGAAPRALHGRGCPCALCNEEGV